MYEIIVAEKKNLKLNAEENGSNIKVSNFAEVRVAVEKLSVIPGLKKQARLTLGHLPHASKGEATTLHLSTFRPLETELIALSKHTNSLYQILDATIEKPQEGTIYLRLPELKNLNNFKEEVDLLESSFSQIFNCLNSEVRIDLKGFDVGTPWLVFGVCSAGVGFVATALIASMKIAQEVMETKIKYNQFESSNQEAARNKKVNEAMGYLVDNVAEVEAKRLVEQYHAKPDTKTAEDAIRVAKALKDLSSIFTKGGDLQFPQITQDVLSSESSPEKENLAEVDTLSRQLNMTYEELLRLPTPTEEET